MYKETTYSSSISNPRGLCHVGNDIHPGNDVAWDCVEARRMFPLLCFSRLVLLLGHLPDLLL